MDVVTFLREEARDYGADDCPWAAKHLSRAAEELHESRRLLRLVKDRVQNDAFAGIWSVNLTTEEVNSILAHVENTEGDPDA
jgi:hypothetical protein